MFNYTVTLSWDFKPHTSHSTLLYSWTFSWKRPISLPPSRSLFTSPCLEIQHVFTQTHTQHIKVSPLT